MPKISLVPMVLAVLAMGCAAAADDGAGADLEAYEETEQALFADTDVLHRAAWNSNRTVLKLCWKPSAYRTDSKKALYTAGRQAVQDAIRQTWDNNSWVDVSWISTCSSGMIPIEIKDERASGGPSGMTLNFDFQNYVPSCRPTSGTTPNAAWTSCVRSLAVHEFGHVLGFDHEQNRGNPAGIRCASSAGTTITALEDVGNFTVQGDLAIGPVAPASVMSYCPEGWRDTLHSTDIEGVQALYGGEGRHAVHGKSYAIRSGTRYLGLSSSGGFAYTERLDRAFLVERTSGAGSIRYGDKVRIKYGNKTLCVTLGIGTQWGTVPPAVVLQTSSYHADACIWTMERVEGTVGGSVVDVNDPVYLWMRAPGGTSSSMHADIPFNDKLSIRLLGPFDPL